MFKPQVRTLEIDKDGIATTSGKHAARRSWKEIRSVSEADGCIVILRRNGNAFVVPARAFGSTEERQRFFAFAQSCIRAEICEASLTV